jgi:uncharacterized protein
LSDLALIGSAALLGLAGTPHCAVMCGAACTAAAGPGGARASLTFQATRLLGYAAAGAVVAVGVGALASLAQISPALRPLWTLLHAAALGLGLWLLWYGQQPAWMSALGRAPKPAAAPALATPAGWSPMQMPVRAAVAGSAWVLMPCGLLQSALLLAALTGTAQSGALAMAAFAVASSSGLLMAPWIWQKLRQGGSQPWDRWLTRAAGLMLVGASSWALGHGLRQRIAAYCFGP